MPEGTDRLSPRGGGLRLKRSQKQSLLCVLGLALLPFVVFWQVATFRQLLVAGDILDQYYPAQYLISQQIRQGQIPLWNDLLFSGMPLVSHTGALYPLNLPFVLVPAWVTLSYSLLLHFSLAGVFIFLYARVLGMSRRGATVAGVTFMFCGFSVAHLGHQNIIHTVPWLPLILYAVEKWRRRCEPKWVGLGALAIGLMFLGGHPQIPLFSLGVVAAYICFFSLFPDGSASRWKFAAGGALIVGCGLLIASPLLWDLYDMSQTYRRAAQAGSGYEFFSVMSLQPWYLLSLISPRLFEADISLVEMTGYIGILPLVLAMTAALRWKHKARAFFLLAAIVAVLLVLGRYTPLYRLMYKIPVYNAFRIPPRNWYEFDFAVAVLAGAGLDTLLSAAKSAARWARGMAVAAIGVPALIVLWAIHSITVPQVRNLLIRNGITSWTNRSVWLPVLLILASAVVLLIVSFRPKRWYASVLSVALITADLFFSFGGYLFKAHSTDQSPSAVFAEEFDRLPGSVEFLKQERSPYRIISYSPVLKFDLTEKYNVLTPNLNVLFGINSADAYYGDTAPDQYVDFSGKAFTGSASGTLINPALFRADRNAILSLLNVKYILLPANVDLVSINRMVVDGIALDAYPYSVMELGASTGLISVTLDLPAVPATTLAIATVLQDGAAFVDGEPVARMVLTDKAGRSLTFTLAAGQQTADMTYDCAPAAMKHRRAPVAYDFPGTSACSYHSYYARQELGSEPSVFEKLTVEYLPGAGQLILDKVSLFNAKDGASYPVSTAQGYLSYVTDSPVYRPVYSDRYVRIYENLRVLPRAFLVSQARPVSSAQEANQIIQSGILPDGSPFVPERLALVEAATLASLPAPNSSDLTSAGDEGSAEITAARAGHTEISTSAAQDSLLVYSENYAPSWTATVDGHPTPLYRTDGALLGVSVPAGEHHVVLSYRPLSRYLILLSYLLMLFAAALWIAPGVSSLQRSYSRRA